MGYLLDTNVISETVRLRPKRSVSRWFSSVSSLDLHLSVVTLGEIRKGIENPDFGHSRPYSLSTAGLTNWLQHGLIVSYGRNIIDVDRSIADKWGRLMAHRPKNLSDDTFLAATAIVRGHVMVTLNEKDFRGIEGLEILNPNRN